MCDFYPCCRSKDLMFSIFLQFRALDRNCGEHVAVGDSSEACNVQVNLPARRVIIRSLKARSRRKIFQSECSQTVWDLWCLWCLWCFVRCICIHFRWEVKIWMLFDFDKWLGGCLRRLTATSRAKAFFPKACWSSRP